MASEEEMALAAAPEDEEPLPAGMSLPAGMAAPEGMNGLSMPGMEAAAQSLSPARARGAQIEAALMRALNDTALDIGIIPPASLRLIGKEALFAFAHCGGCHSARKRGDAANPAPSEIKHTYACTNKEFTAASIPADDANFLRDTVHFMIHLSHLATEQWYKDLRVRVGKIFKFDNEMDIDQAVSEILCTVVTCASGALLCRTMDRDVPDMPQPDGIDMSKGKIMLKDIARLVGPVDNGVYKSWAHAALLPRRPKALPQTMVAKFGSMEKCKEYIGLLAHKGRLEQPLTLSVFRARSFMHWYDTVYIPEEDRWAYFAESAAEARILERAQIDKVAVRFSDKLGCSYLAKVHQSRLNVAQTVMNPDLIEDELYGMADAVAKDFFDIKAIRAAAEAFETGVSKKTDFETESVEHALLDCTAVLAAVYSNYLIVNLTGRGSNVIDKYVTMSHVVAAIVLFTVWFCKLLASPFIVVHRLVGGENLQKVFNVMGGDHIERHRAQQEAHARGDYDDDE